MMASKFLLNIQCVVSIYFPFGDSKLENEKSVCVRESEREREGPINMRRATVKAHTKGAIKIERIAMHSMNPVCVAMI